MKELIRKLVKVEAALAADRGELSLFALFLREGSPNRWDLLVASDWAEKDKYETLREISARLQKALTRKDLLKLSRIVIIEQGNPSLAALQRAVQAEHGDREIRDGHFFGLEIRHAHVITSKARAAA